jgi:hypothetical protein
MHDRQMQAALDEMQKLATFIHEQLNSGADRETIKIRLMASGVPEEVATDLLDEIYKQSPQLLEAEQSTEGYLLPAMIGGGLAAVVGGLIWGMIAIGTGYEIGWIAWGVGLVAGWGVLIAARGRTGPPIQLVAVASAVLGIAIGKYFTFYEALKEYTRAEFGPEAVAQMSLLAPGVVQAFRENIGAMLSGFDAIWIILAVGTAWGIPRVRSPEEEQVFD